MTTRRDLLVLLRTQPGITVAELARALHLTGMGVRRHLDVLAAEGIAARMPPPAGARRGRPPAGWRLTAAGHELFPRRYDRFAVDLLEDVLGAHGPDGLSAVLARRTRRLADEYNAYLDGSRRLGDRIAGIARLRDEEGYEASSSEEPDGSFVLTEANCAVHQVAEQCPAVCDHELDLLRELVGPGAEVTRTKYVMTGDPVCAYRIRAAATPAAPA